MVSVKTTDQLRTLADSALLKVIQYGITTVAVPLAIWGGNTILDRLGKIEEALNKAATISATFELRMQSVERARADYEATNKLQVEDHYRIRRLEEMVDKKK